MSYVAKTISHSERLLFLTRPHWIYILTGVIWFSIFVSMGIGLDAYFSEYLNQYSLHFFLNLKLIYLSGSVTPISIIFTLIGITAFWPFFMIYISSEIGLTNERIICKTGLIFIQIEQVDLDDIRSEHIDHGWIGWLLGYGRIRLDCRFLEDVKLPSIPNPYGLIKASHNARKKHPEIEYGGDEFSSNIKLLEHQQDQESISAKSRKLRNLVKINFWKSTHQKN